MQSNVDMETFVIELLKNKLPSYYHYHNCEHTLYVMEKAVEIGKHENCTETEIELVRTAALWHDAGCINKYTGHEEESCLLAQRYMPTYGYPADEINKVCGMIRATKTPQSPTNKLEEIVADADLEYLGTDSVVTKAHDLFRELQHLNPLLTEEEWNRVQIAFLQKHKYFTRFCKENRVTAKAEYLNSLMNNNSRQ